VLGESELVTAGLGEAQVGNLVVKGHGGSLPLIVGLQTRRAPLGSSWRVITHAGSPPV
jgi:hypothetical protein